MACPVRAKPPPKPTHKPPLPLDPLDLGDVRAGVKRLHPIYMYPHPTPTRLADPPTHAASHHPLLWCPRTLKPTSLASLKQSATAATSSAATCPPLPSFLLLAWVPCCSQPWFPAYSSQLSFSSEGLPGSLCIGHIAAENAGSQIGPVETDTIPIPQRGAAIPLFVPDQPPPPLIRQGDLLASN